MNEEERLAAAKQALVDAALVLSLAPDIGQPGTHASTVGNRWMVALLAQWEITTERQILLILSLCRLIDSESDAHR